MILGRVWRCGSARSGRRLWISFPSRGFSQCGDPACVLVAQVKGLARNLSIEHMQIG